MAPNLTEGKILERVDFGRVVETVWNSLSPLEHAMLTFEGRTQYGIFEEVANELIANLDKIKRKKEKVERAIESPNILDSITQADKLLANRLENIKSSLTIKYTQQLKKVLKKLKTKSDKDSRQEKKERLPNWLQIDELDETNSISDDEVSKILFSLGDFGLYNRLIQETTGAHPIDFPACELKRVIDRIKSSKEYQRYLRIKAKLGPRNSNEEIEKSRVLMLEKERQFLESVISDHGLQKAKSIFAKKITESKLSLELRLQTLCTPDLLEELNKISEQIKEAQQSLQNLLEAGHNTNPPVSEKALSELTLPQRLTIKRLKDELLALLSRIENEYRVITGKYPKSFEQLRLLRQQNRQS